MRIFAPITDYIRNSVLTTKGDIVMRNASTATRLAIGGIGRILHVGPIVDSLEYINPYSAIFSEESTAENEGGTLHIVGGWQTICEIDLGTLALNRRFWSAAKVDGVQDATRGELWIQIIKPY